MFGVVAAVAAACGWHRAGRRWRRTGGVRMRGPGVMRRIEIGRANREAVRAFAQAEVEAAYAALPVLVQSVLSRVSDDPVCVEAMRRDLAESERALAGPNPSAAVSLAACCVTLATADSIYAAALNQAAGPRAAEAFDRRATRAEKRRLMALKSLAIVRSLEAGRGPIDAEPADG